MDHGYSNAMADAGVKCSTTYYLKHQSLYLDLIIVPKTIGVMLLFKGAHLSPERLWRIQVPLGEAPLTESAGSG